MIVVVFIKARKHELMFKHAKLINGRKIDKYALYSDNLIAISTKTIKII